MTRAMTPQDAAYAQALNIFGSDPESTQEHQILEHLREEWEAARSGIPDKAATGEASK